MKVAVWDTYVKMKSGSVLHFDIIVPDDLKDACMIYSYGRNYLERLGEPAGVLSGEECKFCHIEEPAIEMIESIEQQGYFILNMGIIPASLPENYSRRDLIFHLKAHYPEFRFNEMSGKSVEELEKLLH